MKNIERLIELRDTLVKDKKSHDQKVWAKVKLKAGFPKGATRIEVDCATAACAAGHTCLLAGDAFVIEEEDLEFDSNGKPFYHPTQVRTRDGQLRGLETRARDLLGLNEYEAERLFFSANSHNQTIDLLDEWIGESP